GQLGSKPALLALRTLEALAEPGVGLGRAAPPFDPTRRLDSRDPRREMPATEPELGREGRTVRIERLLLDHRRRTERAAPRDPADRRRRPPELPLEDRQVVHAPATGAFAADVSRGRNDIRGASERNKLATFPMPEPSATTLPGRGCRLRRRPRRS